MKLLYLRQVKKKSIYEVNAELQQRYRCIKTLKNVNPFPVSHNVVIQLENKKMIILNSL